MQIDPKCDVQFLYLATVTQIGQVAAFEVRTGTLYLVFSRSLAPAVIIELCGGGGCLRHLHALLHGLSNYDYI